jgi:hypothetical protein
MGPHPASSRGVDYTRNVWEIRIFGNGFLTSLVARLYHIVDGYS